MADDLKKYLKPEVQQDNTQVKLQPRLTQSQLQDNQKASAYKQYGQQQAQRDSELALHKKGQSTASNFFNDMGTTMIKNVTQFQMPNKEEIEKGRSGWSGRGELIRDGITYGLGNELLAGAMGAVASGAVKAGAKNLISKAGNAISSIEKVGTSSLKPSISNPMIIKGPENSFRMGTLPEHYVTKEEALAGGNKWAKEWYAHPEIQRRMKINNRGVMKDIRNGAVGKEVMSLNPDTKVKFPSMFEEIVGNQGSETGKMFLGKEGPIGGLYYPQSMQNHPTLRGRTFVNPALPVKEIPQVVGHEVAHTVTNGGAAHSSKTDNMLLEVMGGQKRIDFAKMMNASNPDAVKYISYVSQPSEIHAGLNQLRMHYGLTPTDRVSEQLAEKMIREVKADAVPMMSSDIGSLYGRPADLAKALNKIFTPAGVAGAAALQLKSKK